MRSPTLLLTSRLDFPTGDSRLHSPENGKQLLARLLLFALTLAPAAFTQQGDPNGDPQQVVFEVRVVQANRQAQDAIGRERTQRGAVGPGSEAGLQRFRSTDLAQVHVLKETTASGVLVGDEVRGQRATELARLRLVTTLGAEATYLIGGRRPIQVITDPSEPAWARSGAPPDLPLPLRSGSPAERRRREVELGVRLVFSALMLPDGRLRTNIQARSRSVDFEQSTVRKGIFEPAVVNRLAERFVDLKPGQSAVLTGLLDRATLGKLALVPGLDQRRLLARVRAEHDAKPNTSLVLVVTPRLESAAGGGN